MDSDVDGAKPYYVMEFCELGSLETIGGATFKADIAQAVTILGGIAAALAAAHNRKIFHRDLKPSNILLRSDHTPLLADFGICHLEGDIRLTMTDRAMGARDYTAPEMETGGERRWGGPSEKTDVYGLGKVLFWMLSGGAMFSREDHRASYLADALGDQSWEHVHILLDQVLIEDPRKRFGLQQFMTELEKVRYLVMGAFAPLKPSIGIKCRFCGLGTYERVGNIVTEKVAVLRGAGLGDVLLSANVMFCNNCGHVELFSFNKTSPWWGK